jgi:hypothetical protein
MAAARELPWISIPPYPLAGQPYAFVDRETQVAQLYKPMVNAGNAALSKPGSRVRAVVYGYMGAGKSSVIYQVLGMLRSSFAVAEGQRLTMPPGLVEAQSPERWLILRASGKHVPSFEAVPEAIRALALSALAQLARDAERDLPGVLPRIGLFHWLLNKDTELQAEVRSALGQLVQTIDLVRNFEGAQMTRKREGSDSNERTKSAGADIEAQLKTRAGDSGLPAEGQAAIKTAASILRKSATAAKTTWSVEHQITVSPELAVDALNAFFARTDRAGIPTVLVLDDFDEFASADAASLEGRAAVLRGVLGSFSSLAPTCFVIGVRHEYMDEDIRRQYPTQVFVPPMDRATALHALHQWGQVQEPPLSLASAEALRELGERCIRRLPENRPVVVPFQFLQMISTLCSHLSNGLTSLETSDLEILETYVKYDFSPDAAFAMHRIATVMPDADIDLCAAAESLDPKPYELTEGERRALRKAGLIRPALAGASEDERIVLDPVLAYLAAARGEPDRESAPGERRALREGAANGAAA